VRWVVVGCGGEEHAKHGLAGNTFSQLGVQIAIQYIPAGSVPRAYQSEILDVLMALLL
jgi:hypothetical protein